ncbi:MAG: hypothetical protein O8C67_13760 [Candidatus Methanoperedens sp.]|nr:hypothetical protein [Candidatus Methanoperedens sp.]MCZ7405977.1 hypothetical protein [Candidatus Methanoperedens sp.]
MNLIGLKRMILGLQIMLLGGFIMIDPSSSLGGIEFGIVIVGLIVGVSGYGKDD